MLLHADGEHFLRRQPESPPRPLQPLERQLLAPPPTCSLLRVIGPCSSKIAVNRLCGPGGWCDVCKTWVT